MNLSILCRVVLTAGLIGGAAQAALAQTPGTIPGGHRGAAERSVIVPAAASGLNVIYRKYGRYRTSIAAAGSNNASHTIKVVKPDAAAKVDKAFLMSASNFSTVIANGDVKLNGTSITWSNSVFNGLSGGSATFFNNVLADVTSIVKPVVDAMPAAGTKLFTLAENSGKNSAIDGEILAVVFTVPTGDARTVALMFGGQQLAGDRFEISLTSPIDPAKVNARLDMGLGISFSYQENSTQQYSIVNVNGKRLSTSAGGNDDGGPFNGGLITVGGVGDSANNPPPNATPTNARTDDERYNLLKFITKTTKIINIDTLNPSNDDNILFAWFEFSAQGEVNKDTDGDGLLDSWEISGYDHNGDGVIDVPLPALGANYKHKDIFIAYAWMDKGPSEAATHQPSAAVLNAITAAFNNAPVTNPDGTTGIHVHWKNLGMIPFQANINLTSTNWDAFDTIMDPKVSEAERVIYHRMINGRKYDNGNSSGLSRGIPEADFFEALPSSATTAQRAGTIMHELGHNLGLRHGGVDHENYKPNHLSIMSYANQFSWLLKGGQPKLDYERFNQQDLNENALNEANGLSLVAGGDAPIATYGVRWFVGGVQHQKNTGANTNVDWNNNGNATQPSVAAEINNTASKTILHAQYPEWTNIVYDGGNIGASGAARLKSASRKRNALPLPPDALKELSLDDFLKMESNKVEVK